MNLHNSYHLSFILAFNIYWLLKILIIFFNFELFIIYIKQNVNFKLHLNTSRSLSSQVFIKKNKNIIELKRKIIIFPFLFL